MQNGDGKQNPVLFLVFKIFVACATKTKKLKFIVDIPPIQWYYSGRKGQGGYKNEVTQGRAGSMGRGQKRNIVF